MLDDDDNKNYFKTNIILKTMRFFNLLEPDRNILSISKIATWFMLAILVIVLYTMPDNLDVIFGAATGMVATLLNYSYRRWTQVNNIKYKRNEQSDSEDDMSSSFPIQPTVMTTNIQVDSPEEKL